MDRSFRIPTREEIERAFIPPTVPTPPMQGRWASVEQVVPSLRVQMIGETDVVAVTPKSLVANLQLSDIVWTTLTDKGELVVVGRLGGSVAEGVPVSYGASYLWVGDILFQWGRTQVTASASPTGGPVTQLFPIAFDAAPRVVASTENSGYLGYQNAITATQFDVYIRHVDNSSATFTRYVHWVAMGTKVQTGGGVVAETGNVPWLELSPYFAADVSNYGSPYGPAQYRLVYDHGSPKLQLRGLLRISAGRSGTAIDDPLFTLPVGARPLNDKILITGQSFAGPATGAASAGTAHTHNSFNGGTSMAGFRLNINTAGEVFTQVPASNSSYSIAANGWIALDGAEGWLD